jgi:hypothetical protein
MNSRPDVEDEECNLELECNDLSNFIVLAFSRLFNYSVSVKITTTLLYLFKRANIVFLQSSCVPVFRPFRKLVNFVNE